MSQTRKRMEPSGSGRAHKRRNTSQVTSGGVFSCFTLDGNEANVHRRSTFSPRRKEEVKSIRRKGACLRCRLLKRACSGEDPCKTCIAAARAAAQSKALMWMECIRPSFQSINIFDKGPLATDRTRIDSIMANLLKDDVYLDFHIPFALNVEAASSHLARWLSEDDENSSFSVVGVFSCSTNTNMLQNALDPEIGRDLRLFVHLTTHLYTTGMQGGYQEYTDEEIKSVRDCVGNRLLQALDPILRPAEIEASEDKLAKLRSLFLLLLGTIVGMRYICSDVFEEASPLTTDFEKKQEALLQLLCHYLIYIGKATALLEHDSDEKSLLHKWRTHWNKPAAFTWNSCQGLEMHYRIEPPADWIVSSSEDESLSSIDIDLSEADDILFPQDSDLVKCTSCSTLFTSPDNDSLCSMCKLITLDDFDKGYAMPEIDFTLFDDDDSGGNPYSQSDAEAGSQPNIADGGLDYSTFDPLNEPSLLGLNDPPITVCGEFQERYFESMKLNESMGTSISLSKLSDIISRAKCSPSFSSSCAIAKAPRNADPFTPCLAKTSPLELPDMNFPLGALDYQESNWEPIGAESGGGNLEVNHEKLDDPFEDLKSAAEVWPSQHDEEKEPTLDYVCGSCISIADRKKRHSHSPNGSSRHKFGPCPFCHKFVRGWCYGDCKDAVSSQQERLLI